MEEPLNPIRNCRVTVLLLFFAPKRTLGHVPSVVGAWRVFHLCCKGRHMQALSTRSGRSRSESSSSGDGDEKVLAKKAQWAQQTELREVA